MGDGHYFDDEPDVASSPSTVTLTLPDLTVDLQADTGVFSGGRIDPGTKLLLLEAGRLSIPTDGPLAEPDRPPGTAPRSPQLLDLGCGYGPIAVTLAHRHPDAHVWAVDVNARARDLAAANLATRGFAARSTVAGPDDVPDDVRFDLIVSNPPIRIGKSALHTLLTRWLQRLAPGGTAELVVQKHLGSDSLARWLTGRGWPTERVVSRGGYRLLRVTQAPELTGTPGPAPSSPDAGTALRSADGSRGTTSA